jgi:hypothetical protein
VNVLYHIAQLSSNILSNCPLSGCATVL